MYSIEFIVHAQKEFKQLSRDDQLRVISVLERVRMRPHDFSLRLSGSRAYRVRAGDLRIIMDIIEAEERIVILKIGNRENVYIP